MQYTFIKNNLSIFSVEEMCECFGLSRSGYYDWSNRAASRRSIEDEKLKVAIKALHKKAKGRYGHRPIYGHLQDEQIGCGRDRTLRLMKQLGLAGIQSKGFKPQYTNSKHPFGYSPNLLKQLGKPERCDQIWVSDTTYLRTEDGWTYLATVMDLFSRRIVGWSVSSHNNSKLVCRALQAGVLTRGGHLPEGLILHSDRGSTYASDDYQRLLSSLKIAQSMSAKGNCYDNAAMESFYGKYKTSSVRDQAFVGEDQARSHAFEYIELFYNRFRKHSSLGYKSPVQFECEKNSPMGEATASLPACIHNN
jgi:transposase InsO family protein